MNDQIDVHELEDWSCRAAEALQEFCDQAQEDAGNPDGEDQLADIRQLLKEHCYILNGKPVWTASLHLMKGGDESTLMVDGITEEK